MIEVIKDILTIIILCSLATYNIFKVRNEQPSIIRYKSFVIAVSAYGWALYILINNFIVDIGQLVYVPLIIFFIGIFTPKSIYKKFKNKQKD